MKFLIKLLMISTLPKSLSVMRSKARIVFVLLMIFNLCVYSQSLPPEKMKDLLPYFSICGNGEIIEDGNSELFSSEAIQKIFTDKADGGLFLVALCAKKYDFGILLFLETGFPQYESRHVNAILVFEQGYYRKQGLGLNYADCEDEIGDKSETFMVNDSIIQAVQSKYNYNSSTILESKYKYFLVNEWGINQIEVGEYSDKRKFTESSIRLLDIDYLKKYTKQELDIMRNEIFADHGYIFKTKKWQDYFLDKPWYNPQHEDVVDKLSVIERINVQNILEASKI